MGPAPGRASQPAGVRSLSTVFQERSQPVPRAVQLGFVIFEEAALDEDERQLLREVLDEVAAVERAAWLQASRSVSR